MGKEQPNNNDHESAAGRRFFGAIIAIVALAVFLLGRPFAAHSDDALFSPAADSAAITTDDVGAARRARAVRVNWNALNPRADEVRLNLFDDVNLTAVFRRVDHSVTGGYVWIGDIAGEDDGVVTLSVQNGVLSGSVYRFGRAWADIRPAVGGAEDLDTSAVYTVVEIDPNASEPDGQDYMIPQPSLFDQVSPLPQDVTCQEDGSVIQVMVVYTPQARDFAGGKDAIEALISQRVSQMNTANDASAVIFDWNLANLAEVAYVESGNINVDLQNLQMADDGIMDEVQAQRNAFKADVVALIISEGSNNACGYAYQMNSLGAWFEGYGYGVVALDYPGTSACSDLTLAHEMGHILGNAHDRGHASGAVLFPFSYGYQSPTEAFRDIMSYDCVHSCPRINQWANPDVWYQGEQTGVDFEADPTHAADIVRSMHESRVLVSNFRADCVEPTATPTGTPTDVPIATDTPTPSMTPTETVIPADTSTPTPTLTPTETLTPSITPTGTLPTPTRTPRPTATLRPTRTPHPTPTSEVPTPAIQLLYMPAVIRN